MAVKELGIAPQKALEAVLFIATRLKNADLHGVLKIRYFADKLHFSKYGFPASGDKYVAMHFGPVASFTYDLLKVARGDANEWAMAHYGKLVQGTLEVEKGGGHMVTALRDADTSYLSQSEMEMLTEAIALNGHMEFEERTAVSHDSAWKLAWGTAQRENKKQHPMPIKSIAGALPNAQEVLAYLND